MSFNGSGTFVVNSAGQPVVANTVISATVFNALTADLATGLSTCITKDGQTTVTANIPFGNNKITALGAGTAASDAANLGQVQSTAAKLVTVTGTDTITGTMSPALTAYAAGQLFYFIANAANTGAVTINIDGLGAKSITRDGSTALAGGDINSGEFVVIIYDGTRFQMINAANSFGNTTINGTLTVTGNTALQANVSITSTLSVGGTFAVTGAATLGSTLAVTGKSDLPTVSTASINAAVALITTGTVTNLTASGASIASANIGNLQFTAASIASINAGVAVVTNLTATSASIASMNAGVALLTTATVTSLTATGASVASANVGTAVVTGMTVTGASIASVNAGTATLSGNFTLNGGTANGVLYLNGSKVATSGSALVFDGSKLSLPTVLAIKGAENSNIAKIAMTRTDASYSINNETTLRFYYQAANTESPSTIIHGMDANLFFWNNSSGSELMRLNSTGLGIGTASPTTKLEVSSSDLNNIFVTNPTTSGATTGSGVGFKAYNGSSVTQSAGIILTSNTWSFGTYSANQLSLGSDGTGGLALRTANSAPITFFTGGATAGLSTEKMRLDSSGNLGLGVTPSGWDGTAPGLVFGTSAKGSLSYAGGATSLGDNFYRNSIGYRYVTTAAVSLYQASAGTHAWYNAPSGTAGNAITFTQAMTLDASGRLGIGTTSPAVNLEVQGSASLALFRNNTSSATTSYITVVNANNSSNGLVMAHINDGTGYFGTQNNAALRFVTNDTERARITAGGDFLVGKTATGLTVGVQLEAVGGSSFVRSSSSNADLNLYVYSTGAAAARFYVGMGGTVYATNTTISAISDQRFKENIRDLDVGLDAILALKPRKFDWKEGKGKDIKDDRGFVAQEFEKVFPDLVDKWADPAPEGEEPYKSVRQDLIPVLVKAMQEQQAMIEELKAKVAQLEAR